MGTLLSDASPWAKWRPQHEQGMKIVMLSFSLSACRAPLFRHSGATCGTLVAPDAPLPDVFPRRAAEVLQDPTTAPPAHATALYAKPLKRAKSRLNLGMCARL